MATSEVTGVTTGQPNLVKQDLSTLDVSKLSAVSKEVISRQATINIGTIGHVAHGKSTVVKAVSGVQTVRFKNELERNITIKLDKNRKGSMGQRFFKNGKCTNVDENVCIKNGLISNTDHNSENKNHTDVTTLNTKPVKNDKKLRIRNKLTEENILKNILRNVKRRRNSEAAEAEEKFEPPKKKLKQTKTFDSQISTANLDEKSFDIDDEKINEKQNETAESVEQTGTTDCSLELTDDTKTKEKTSFEENSTDSLEAANDTKELRVIIKPLLSKDLTSYKNSKINTFKNEYIVENIIAQKVDKGQQLFLVKWKDWSATYNSWEPLAHLENCPLILAQFLKQEYESRHEEVAKLKCELLSPKTLRRSVLEALFKELGTLKPLDEIELLRSLIALLDVPVKDRDPIEISRVKRLIRISELHKKRNVQLESLKNWENEINMNETTQGKIRVENNVDLEMPPKKFIYINDYLPGKGVTIPNDPPIGCECKLCSYRSKDCCAEQGGGICYNSKKLIKVAPGAPVYECNKRCKCDKSCQNRVVQNGGTVPLCIFRTDNGRGWGVKAERRIPTGKYICTYVGEVILFEEAERRGREYDAMGRTYLFDLDFNSSDHPYTVDAATYGNISHFINHSCDPNLGVWAVWIDCLDPNLPSLALFAKRDIEKDEELSIDYMARNTLELTGDSPAMTDANSAKQRVRLDLPKNKREAPASRTRCKCGAKTCRQYLF